MLEIITSVPRRNVAPVARFLKVPVTIRGIFLYLPAMLTFKIKFSIERLTKSRAENCGDKHKEM